MSTSFISRNKVPIDAGCNITGAGFLRDLLEKLGHKNPQISGVGSGPHIPAREANAWGMSILKAMEEDRLMLVKIKDGTMMGGYRDKIAILSDGEWDTQINGNKPPPEDIVPLDDGTKSWLTKVSKFFMLCGGFTQY